MNDKTFKTRLNYIINKNKKTIKDSKLRQTCTRKSEKILKRQMKGLETSKLIKRFEKWIIYCLKMEGKCKPNMLLIRNTEDSTEEIDERTLEKEIGLVYSALFRHGSTKGKEERKSESYYGALM